MQSDPIHEDVPGGVPHQDVDARRAGGRRGQAPADQRRAPAHRLQAHRGDARRARGHRRHRRLGDPDAAGHHPGGGGRGHRLRHDGRQDHAACGRPARQPGAAARGDRARGAARPRTQGTRSRRVEQGAGLGGHGLVAARARVQRAVRATTRSWTRPTTACTWARWAPAITSSRSASTKRASSGSCCTRVRAVSATRSARMFIELAKRDAMRHNAQPARPRPGVLRGRQPLLRRLRARGGLGADVMRRSTAS